MMRIILRIIALVIALAGFIDPTITTRSAAHPEVSVLAAEPARDSALANRIARDLSRQFDAVRAVSPAAIATVVVGDGLPGARDIITSPVIAVPNTEESLRIESIVAPTNAPIGGRIPVQVSLRAPRPAATPIDVALRADGVVVDRVVLRPSANQERLETRLSFVPATTGTIRLQVELKANHAVTTSDALVEVNGATWPVLVYDVRASWMSTFVRRAIERDTRFAATSRVVTSRSVSRDVGVPPARLADALRSSYDAIVVGAPDALTADDVNGLEAFMRQRGGSVVLLIDTPTPAGPLARLTGVAHWDSTAFTPATAAIIHTEDGISLRATEIAWPTALPAGAQTLYAAKSHPLVWRVPVGAGEMIVSGMLDAWRYRDADNGGFDRFWQTALARAAARTLPAIDIRIAPNAIAPGDSAAVTVTSRDALLRGTGNVSLSASLDDSVPVRLWPTPVVGEFRGTLRAPRRSGAHHVSVAVNGDHAATPFFVAADVRQPSGSSGELLAAWAASTNGVALTSSRADEIAAAIRHVRAANIVAEPWHPMRSGWWILPFALALAAEWWLRRRRGLR